MQLSQTYPSPTARRAAEAERIMNQYGPEAFREIMEMLERNFLVLHNRAQVLLGLCGIIISTTGFSGRNIAGSSLTGQILIIIGVAMVLISAAVVCWSVLHLRWLTMTPGDDLRQWLTASLAYRDYKTTCYRIALFIMMTGLTAYVAAIVLMLLNPNAPTIPAR